MSFNINEFKAKTFSKDFLRPNKFLFRMPRPAGFDPTNAFQKDAIDNIEYWCEGGNLPGLAISMHQVLHYGYGMPENKPFIPIIQDISMSILSDGNGGNFQAMHDWLRLIINHDMRGGINPSNSSAVNRAKPFEVAYRADYVVDSQIIAYDEAGVETIDITLRDSFPSFVGDIPLNWQDNNTVMRLPVTITFNSWFFTNNLL